MAKKSNNNKGKNNNKKPNTNNNEVTKQPVKKSKAAQDILNKYGLADEHKPSEKEIETLEAQKLEEKQKGKVASLADDIGWQKPAVLSRNALYGIFMGMSDAVPGYSGGTTLNLIGFYQELVSNVKLIFKPDVKKYFWKYLLWFLPFAICWAGVLVGFLYLVNMAGEANKGVVLVFLFGSFALFSIPLFYLANKDKFIDRKLLMNQTKEKKGSAILHWVIFSIAAALMLTIGLVARFVPQISVQSGEELVTVTGVTFAKPWDVKDQFDALTSPGGNLTGVVFSMLIVSMVAGFVVLIPGISGGLVMFMTGYYTKVSTIISQTLHGNMNGLPLLITVICGAILGLIISVITINSLLKKFEEYFYSASLGFVLIAPIAIFAALSSYDYGFLKDGATLGLSIGMIFVAIVINGIIFTVLNETKKINFPKLRMINKEKN